MIKTNWFLLYSTSIVQVLVIIFGIPVIEKKIFLLFTNKIDIATPPSLKCTDGADYGQCNLN